VKDCNCPFVEYCRKAEKSNTEEQIKLLNEIQKIINSGNFESTKDLVDCGDLRIALTLNGLAGMLK